MAQSQADERRPGRRLRLRRSEEHTSELQSLTNLVCRLLLEKKKKRRRPGPNIPCGHDRYEPLSSGLETRFRPGPPPSSRGHARWIFQHEDDGHVDYSDAPID